jgi:hypothetical protein
MGEGKPDPHDFYANYMEAALLRNVHAFYTAERERLASLSDMHELLQQANQLLRQEADILRKCRVSAASVEQGLHVARDAFILPALGALDEALYHCIASPGAHWSLAREMYLLLRPSTTGIGQMARVLERALVPLLTQEASATPPPADASDPRAYVFALFKLYERYSERVRNPFDGDAVMQSAFEKVRRAIRLAQCA